MGRRKKGDKVDGWVNLDKPEGLGSTEAVSRVRRLFNAQKAGHAGTLDPLASGVLPIALGEATKTIPYCQDYLKGYSFDIIWGEERSTDDAEGEVIVTSDIRPEKAQIEAVIPRFTGDLMQMPPRFSAIKVNGERAYDLARAGEDVDLKPRPVYIEELVLASAETNFARLNCICGKGTYMRSLARDMARQLGTAGYIANLRRTAVGPYTAKNAISLEKIEELAHSARLEEALLPLETALDGIPALALNEAEAARLKSGQKLLFISRPDLERLQRAGLEPDVQGGTAVAMFQGQPVALVNVEGVEIQPVRVLNVQPF